MNAYDNGDVVRLNMEFTDNDTGDFVDPTTVTAKVKDPIGAISNYVVTGGQIIRDSLGKFHLNVEPTIQGVWAYRFEGTGSNKAAEESSFQVRESQFD